MLPTEKTKPIVSLDNLTTLIYGPAKIGKSTWCSQADKALFLATEPGLNSLETWQIPITNWQELLFACSHLEKDKHEFKTIVIDTIDNAWSYCSAYICEKYKIDHESDLGYGKGYALIATEFQRVITRLAFMPYGFVMVSHAHIKDIENRNGVKISKMIPGLPDKARKMITGLVDMILYCDFDLSVKPNKLGNYPRIIRTKPSPNFEAGDRTGKLPALMPLDYSVLKENIETLSQNIN